MDRNLDDDLGAIRDLIGHVTLRVQLTMSAYIRVVVLCRSLSWGSGLQAARRESSGSTGKAAAPVGG